MIIAIDFDDTLCDSHNIVPGHRMGPPEPGAIMSTQRLAAEGHHIVIFTARNVQVPQIRQAVADWLDYFKIPYHGITNIKRPDFDVYIDNRAMHYDSWPQVMHRISKMS